MIYDCLQLIGGIILSIGYIPQIKQIIQTKSVKDLNFKTFCSVLVGVLLMEIYAINLVCSGVGIMFLVTNSLSFLLSIILCSLIIIYRRN